MRKLTSTRHDPLLLFSICRFPASGLTRILLFAALCVSAGRAQVDVLTGNYNNKRTNANLNETVLIKANVSAAKFGRLYTLPVNGFIHAQPLYVHGVPIPGKGPRNVLYVATMNNDVYAFDADAPGDPFWHVNLGPAVPAGDYGFDDIESTGILSTPVIDRGTSTIYAVANTKEDGKYFYRLHALDLATGDEKMGGPGVIQATLPGFGPSDSNDGQIHFVPYDHLQRPGLVLVNNTVYVGFGSHGDIGLFRGWFLGYNASNVQEQVQALATTPDNYGGAIWQAGRAPVADENGNIYAITGNGYFDGINNWSESVLKFDISSKLRVDDWFTPDNWTKLNDVDDDFGSCGPVLTSSGLLITGGKDGVIYLLDRNNLGHLQTGNAQIPQSFAAIGFGIFNMAYWDRSDGGILYLRGYNDAIKAFRLTNGRFDPHFFSQTTFGKGLPLDGMAVSANGSADDSGILWLTATANPDRVGPGTMHALSATDLSQELWSSAANPLRDGLGVLSKYTAPTVVNGKVYVPTFSNQLVVYGLLSSKIGISSVVNAASGLLGPMAPGEMVTIFGSGLGPGSPAGAQLNSNGRLSTSIGGTQVTFDGNPAPLIYAQDYRVMAVVPNSVAGKQHVVVQARFGTHSMPALTVSVTDTRPGLFTLDQSGQGQAAVLNQDGTINSPSNPAERGSIMVFFGTGQGLTTPQWDEDDLSPNPLPKPLNEVVVSIGGKDADVLYAGAAPGLAALIQVNAVVPTDVKPGAAVPVVVAIGKNKSQERVTVSVK
ncbi:MAG: hypothetical protein DMG57_05065 [Acidobacteria bacterium]|nr:MAG: hypothetical protein DMG57_05065 [Acidobacteriota bacterium]